MSRHRLSGFLLAAIEDESLPATEQQVASAIGLQRATMERVLTLDRLMLSAVERLTEAGLPHRLLKGCAHAHLLYPDPSLRPYVDVDILVPSESFASAVAALETVGVTRVLPELRADFDRRFGKGATLRAPHGGAVDLHRTFVAGPFAMWIDASSLFDHFVSLTVGDMEVLALATEERCLHACFHAAVSDLEPALISLRDVVQAASAPALDLDRLLRIGGQWRALSVIAKAVTTAWSSLEPEGEPPLARWARSFEPSAKERRVLRAYEATQHRWAHQAVAGIRAVSGVRSRIAYATAIVAPSRRAMAWRGRSAEHRLGRVQNPLVGDPQADETGDPPTQ
ncbi:MAG: hypothetical protein FD127_1867 [Acidimicrobiaceae bacterium]|nr:MAG: hypothetical protein FD127_1867 [Acidimicrobiaceae bacterium]